MAIRIRSTHPLKQDEVTYFQNWKQCMEVWNNNPCLEVRHSVLHFGLEMPLGTLYGKETDWRAVNETYSERVLFYLSVADGWCLEPRAFALKPKEERHRYNDPKFATSLGVLKGDGALAQRLAWKAFASLFNALIPRLGVKRSEEERREGLNRYNHKGEVEWSYVYNMTPAENVALLRFFRPMGGRYGGIRLQNLPDSRIYEPWGEVNKYLIERVQSFLADYLVFLWKWNGPKKPEFYGKPGNAEEERRQQEVLKRFEEEVAFHNLVKRHRFLMAVMLLCLGEGERMYPLTKDGRTTRLLHQFAMGAEVKSEFYNEETGRLESGNRSPQSLEEARCYANGPRSEAARFLLLRGIGKKAEAEHQESERLHRERAEAEQKKRAVEWREKEAEALRKKADELLQGSHS